jgi:PAS domain S-box-containing protein
MSIGNRLILFCVGLYIAVALLFIALEALIALSATRGETEREIASLASINGPILSQAFWNIDSATIDPILRGITASSAVERAEVRDEHGKIYAAFEKSLYVAAIGDHVDADLPLFGPARSYLLTHRLAGKDEAIIGSLVIYPSLAAERERVRQTVFFGLGRTAAIIALLSLILALATERFLGRPLRDFARQIASLDTSAPSPAAIGTTPEARGELLQVAQAFNNMADRIGLTLAALRDSERRFRSLFEDSPIALWDEDFSKVKARIDEARALGVRDWAAYFEPEERITEFASLVIVNDVNKAAIDLLGLSEKEDVRNSLPKYLDEEAIHTWQRELVAIASGRRSYEGETGFLGLNGARVSIHIKLSIVHGFEEDWSRVLVSIIDISERRRAEEALQENEAKYRGLVEQSSEGITLLDSLGAIVDCNPVLEGITDLGKDEILGKRIWDIEYRLLREESRTEENYRLLKSKWEIAISPDQVDGDASRRKPFELLFQRSDGDRRIIEMTLFPISMRSSRMSGGVIRDVTEQRAAAQALMESLREKELLLQEVHHRVKNNLQIICSLINLQLYEVADSPSTSRSLVDMEARVRSMSLVHEILYQSGDFALVDFSTYIQQLCDHLYLAYLEKPDRISLALSLEKVSLPLDKAIPCGLLINELVVNALKHAFPNGRSGTIEIVMRRETDRKVSLTVKDDGVGAKQTEAEAERHGSIGLSLVKNLTDQLGGVCEIDGVAGMSVRVEFPA